jgi:hypothetical protein
MHPRGRLIRRQATAHRTKASRNRVTCMPVVTGLLVLGVALLSPISADATVSPSPSPSVSSSPKASTAPASEVTFGLKPASVKGIDTRPYFTYSGTPGGHIKDHVAVFNYSTKPLHLAFYATDATSTSTGEFTLLAAGQRPKDLGRWLNLGGKTALSIPARTAKGPGEVIAPFSLTIPANASPGDHAAGLVVSLAGVAKDSNGDQVKLDQRVGARVYLRVSGPLNPSLSVQQLAPTYSPGPFGLGSGQVKVTYRVANTGNVILGAHDAITVKGRFGFGTKTVRLGDVPALLPGESVEVAGVVKGVFPQLSEKVTVTLTPIAPVGAADPTLHPFTATTSITAMPWLVLLILAIVLLLWVLRRWRRRRQGSPGTGPGRSTSPEESGPKSPSGAKRATIASRVVGVAVLVLLGWSVPAQAATSVPWGTDTNALGQIGFCDQQGQPVTEGSVDAHPFVWRAVGTSAAPAPWNKAGKTATLYAYQPRPATAPGLWSGQELTASARYSNAAHPMAAATPADLSFSDFVDTFPPLVQGLYQLRLVLGAPDTPQRVRPYDATTIQVTGSTWHVVGTPASVACNSGTSESIETLLLPSTSLVASTSSSAPVTSSSAPTGTPTQSSGGHSASATPEASASSAADSSAATRSSSAAPAIAAGTTGNSPTGGGGSGQSGQRWFFVIVVAAVLVIGTTASFLVRRRRPNSLF